MEKSRKHLLELAEDANVIEQIRIVLEDMAIEDVELLD